jgi:hypothetical protein
MLLTFSELSVMPAKGVFHELVKAALENEGWTATHDPYHIDLGFVDFYIDLGAERYGNRSICINGMIPTSDLNERNFGITKLWGNWQLPPLKRSAI